MAGTLARRTLLSACAILALGITGLAAPPQDSLATVTIPFSVLANNQLLSPGVYTVRLTDVPVTPVVGQSPHAERWVEFLKNGQVAGRELASVVTGPDTRQVIKSQPLPAGAVKVQTLRGNEYLRVWIGQGSAQYLIHLRATRR
jgi:hypothetical protein